MARVALLVTVLAALCYTSQAIPVPIENAEGTQPELPNINIQRIRDGFKNFIDKIRERMEIFEKELQEKNKFAVSNFDEIIENSKKLLQEKKQDANEIYEKIEKIEKSKEEILRDYQNALNDRIEKIKDAEKEMGGKLKEKLDSMTEGQCKAKEILEKLLGKGQNSDETYGIGNVLKKSKDIRNSIKDNLIEELKIKGKTDEAMKEFRENFNEFKQKGKQLGKELNNKMNQSIDKFKETKRKNVEVKVKELGDMKNKAKGKLDDMKNHIKKLKSKAGLKKKLDDQVTNIMEKMKGISGGLIKEMEDGMKGTINDYNFSKFKEVINTSTNKLKAAMNDLKEKVPNELKNNIGQLMEVIDKMKVDLKKVSDEIKNAVNTLIKQSKETKKKFDNIVVELQKKMLEITVNAAEKWKEKDDINKAKKKLGELKKDFEDLYKEKDAWKKLLEETTKSISKLKQDLKDKTNGLKDNFSKIVGKVKEKFDNLHNDLKDSVEKIKEKMKKMENTLENMATNVEERIKKTIVELKENLKNQTDKMKEKLKEVKDALDKMFEKTQDLPGMIKDDLKEVQDKTSDMIGGATNKIENTDNENTDILAGKLIKQGEEALKNTKGKIMKSQQAAVLF